MPQAVLECAGTATVVEGVRFAGRSGVPLAIRSSGHHVAGLAVCTSICISLNLYLYFLLLLLLLLHHHHSFLDSLWLQLVNRGIVLDLQHMNAVLVDRKTKTAWVQPGASAAHMNAETLAHGLVGITPHISTVGLGGFTLIGGMGHATTTRIWC